MDQNEGSFFKELAQRIEKLEERLARIEEQLRRPAGIGVAKPQRPISPPPVPQRVAVAGEESAETKIGKYWLNRIGVGAIILGFGFLIAYTFRYFGVFAKLGTGYLLALIFGAVGTFLEKKKDLRWYGMGLIGGGWALLYFTTYAAHHIEVVRIIDHRSLDLFFLLLISIGAIFHSFKYKSEIATGIAFILPFMTSAISHVDTFTLLSCLMSSCALAFLIRRFQWHRLAIGGAITTYLVHLIWIKPQITFSPIWTSTSDVAHTRFWLSIGFLTTYWLLYHLLTFSLPTTKTKDENMLTGLSIANAVAYGLLGSYEIFRIAPEGRFAFLFGLGLLYCATGILKRLQERSKLPTVHVLLGMASIAAALPVKFAHPWTSFAWLIEIFLATVLGCYLKRPAYRMFAFVFATMMLIRFLIKDLLLIEPVHLWGLSLQANVLVASTAIASMWGSSLLIKRPSYRVSLLESEKFIPETLTVFGTFFLVAILCKEIGTHWLSLAFILGGAYTLGTGIYFSDKTFRISGLALLGLAILFFLFYNLPGVNTIYRIFSCLILGVVLLIASLAYARYEKFLREK
ncbi:MAG: DUF2339 domain-containing protein [Candidatus Omnitrophota bacterium]